jgi:hypothetical protein
MLHTSFHTCAAAQDVIEHTYIHTCNTCHVHTSTYTYIHNTYHAHTSFHTCAAQDLIGKIRISVNSAYSSEAAYPSLTDNLTTERSSCDVMKCEKTRWAILMCVCVCVYTHTHKLCAYVYICIQAHTNTNIDTDSCIKHTCTKYLRTNARKASTSPTRDMYPNETLQVHVCRYAYVYVCTKKSIHIPHA